MQTWKDNSKNSSEFIWFAQFGLKLRGVYVSPKDYDEVLRLDAQQASLARAKKLLLQQAQQQQTQGQQVQAAPRGASATAMPSGQTPYPTAPGQPGVRLAPVQVIGAQKWATLITISWTAGREKLLLVIETLCSVLSLSRYQRHEFKKNYTIQMYQSFIDIEWLCTSS